MGLYNKYILPKVVDFLCKQKPNLRQREKIIPLAKGKILEIGIGSGLNLPYYLADNVQHLTAIDPSIEMWKENHIETKKLAFGFDFIESFAEEMPLDSNSFDTIVITYTLCSITDTSKALEEMKRVLKPSGKLLFCEHGKAPDKIVEKWQNRINPLWKRIGGGCNLNRDIPLIIKNSGFKIDAIETMYIPGWKPASFNFWGTAKID